MLDIQTILYNPKSATLATCSNIYTVSLQTWGEDYLLAVTNYVSGPLNYSSSV